MVAETVTVDVIKVVKSNSRVEDTVAAVWVDVAVTVTVEVTGDTAREQADVMMLAGYLVKTLGVGSARFWGAWVEAIGSVGSTRAETPLIIVQLVDIGEALRSRFALITVVVVVNVVVSEVAVTVETTLVIVTIRDVTETGVVVVSEVAVTVGVV